MAELLNYILLLSPLYYLYKFLQLTIQGILSRKWVATEGNIIEHFDTDSLYYEESPKWLIKYNYTLDNKNYVSTNIAYIPIVFNYDKFFKKYPIEEKCIVYYNPNDKTKSVLEKGFQKLTIIYIIFFLLSESIVLAFILKL